MFSMLDLLITRGVRTSLHRLPGKLRKRLFALRKDATEFSGIDDRRLKRLDTKQIAQRNDEKILIKPAKISKSRLDVLHVFFAAFEILKVSRDFLLIISNPTCHDQGDAPEINF